MWVIPWGPQSVSIATLGETLKRVVAPQELIGGLLETLCFKLTPNQTTTSQATHKDSFQNPAAYSAFEKECPLGLSLEG